MRRCHDQEQLKTAKVPCLTWARAPLIDYMKILRGRSQDET